LAPHRSADATRHDPPLVVRRFVTDAPLAPAALVAELARQLAGTPASAERALWHGGVHVNGRPLEEPRPVPAGARVVVYAFEREPEPAAFEPWRVLHDGDGVVAVDKPPWWTLGRTRASARLSLEATLRSQLGDETLVAAHRLDRQTSGVALFARGRAGAWAARAFAERAVTKRYVALAAPPPAEDAFVVVGWLGRAPDPARFRFALRAEPPAADVPLRAAWRPRWSRTEFRVLRRDAGRAVVEARPETGRTHQIRVHLASAGAPVVGDDLYGDASNAERCLLHAASLTLPRPTGGLLHLEAPLPADFERGDVHQEVKKLEPPRTS
jgi:23S rRNA pseudouridine1911/1915/1917 synthase